MLRSSRPHRFLRPLLALGLGLALMSGVVGFPALQSTTVSAQSGGPPPGLYELVAMHTGYCLDVAKVSMADAALVIQWLCEPGAENQHWRVEPVADGYYQLVANHSGKALGVAGLSQAEGAPVQQFTISGGLNQQWQFQSLGGGVYMLTARHSGKALDIENQSTVAISRAVQTSIHGGPSQQWLLRPVAAPPRPSTVSPSTADATRFLDQSTFGPTPALVEHVRQVGFEQFLEEQFAAPISSYPTLPLYPTTRDTATCDSVCARDNYSMYPLQNRFFVNALYGEDQLRQRVALALHQIVVVSGVDITQPSWMSPYLQVLDRNAFGNYRQLLYDITLNPAMGNYLDINGNTRTRPNENYAREILQLFSIGTVRLNIDGTQQLDAAGQPIPAYNQDTINNFARVFTGLRFAPNPATGVPNYAEPMVVNEPQHDLTAKTLLNGTVLPANQNTLRDINAALDNIFQDPNIGPFISRQLIQHLVTSNPSPAYVTRVAAVFNGAGGTRGDMKAVIRAILLDPDARGDVKADANYGRLRNPVQFIANVLRAFNAKSADGASQSDGYLNPQAVNMGMDLFRPPSVFSYFSPSTVIPGTAGVRGPEFGIFSTSTALRRDNFVNTMVFSRIATSANAPAGTSIDLAPYQALASNPGQLVDALNTLLLHGTMSTEMRNSIVTAVSAVAASNPLKRARTAIYLITTSSQYQVER
jgi:uncharacterized protein (DUF1800 family)